MFNLEETIAKWRLQMLAAGITTPLPLEELEIHLRQEIDVQTELGQSEEEAFNTAVEKMGQAHILRNEFKKIAGVYKIVRSIMLIIGWLAASCTLLYCVIGLDFNWDFIFAFQPKWNLGAIMEIPGVFVSVVSIWFLAKASRDKASSAVSLLACVLVACFVGVVFPVRYAIFSGKPDPIWFRGSLSLLLCAPTGSWVWWKWRHWVEQRIKLAKLRVKPVV